MQESGLKKFLIIGTVTVIVVIIIAVIVIGNRNKNKDIDNSIGNTQVVDNVIENSEDEEEPGRSNSGIIYSGEESGQIRSE